MLSFAHNIAEFERGLSDAARNQIPFATSQALNDTALEVDEAWKVQMERRLDRPTPFTKQRGLYRRKAWKTRLASEVGVKDIQASYLRWQVDGGRRKPKGRAILIPVGQKLNRYGNMPRGAVKRSVARKDTFVASENAPRTKHLPPGIYKRGKRGKRKGGGQGTKGRVNTLSNGLRTTLTHLVSFEDVAKYRPRLDLQSIAERRAVARFPRHFDKRLRAALATAR